NSAGPVGVGPSKIPDSPVVTLGGMVGPGNYQKYPGSISPAWDPFCDDYHDYKDTPSPNRCEAGLFVRQLDSPNDAASGGLYVAGTGRQRRARSSCRIARSSCRTSTAFSADSTSTAPSRRVAIAAPVG